MAEVTYETKRGDCLDLICFRHYGHTQNRVVEKVLEANRGLSLNDPMLPSGLLIVLPEISTPAKGSAKRDIVRLWSSA